jgi:hypothetical protein
VIYLIWYSMYLMPENVPIQPIYPHPVVEGWDADQLWAIFGEAKVAQEWLQALPYAEFCNWLFRLNGELRGVPEAEYGFADGNIQLTAFRRDAMGKNHKVAVYQAPDEELREGLFRQMQQAVQGMDDPYRMTQLVTVALAEMQVFADANKRTARQVYGLGSYGYNGLPQERWNFSMAVYDREQGTRIKFAGLHNRLSQQYSTFMANKLAEERHELAVAPTVQPVSADAQAPGLAEENRRDAIDYLNESFFNQPLLLAWIRPLRGYLGHFLTNEGQINATEILAGLSYKGYSRLLQIDDEVKQGYIEAIMKAFAEGDETIFGGPITKVIRPYFPERPEPGRRALRLPTAALLPIFSARAADPLSYHQPTNYPNHAPLGPA